MSTLTGRIETALAPFVADGSLPGAVAMVADRDGTVADVATGWRDKGIAAPMTCDTVFRIASLTKAVTTVSALQAVERGDLRLDQPAREILPILGETEVLEGFDAAGRPRLRKPRRPITLRHLLTHTAGFAYDTWDADLARYEELTGLPIVVTGRPEALRSPLRFDPGTRWTYGIGVDMVGLMVEAVTGAPLETAMRRAIFAPLGMADTSFAQRPEWTARLARAHARQADGTLVPVDTPPPPADRVFQPGGNGLFSTAPDYLRFLRALLNGGRLGETSILRPETVAMMMRNQIGDLYVERLVTRDPGLSDTLDLFPGIPQKWGFGFLINGEAGRDGRSAGSVSWGGLYNTYYWIDPSAGLASVFMTQTVPFAEPKSLSALAAFERAIYRG